VPLNCAVAPDSVVYCLTREQLTADILKAFYERGELQTPKEPRGEDEAKEGVEAQAPEPAAGPTLKSYPPVAAQPSDYSETSVGVPAMCTSPAPTPTYQEHGYEEENEFVYWY
jgi:hypothetical protein